MGKRATATSFNTLFTELQNLKALHAALLRDGDREVADCVRRAMRELQAPAVSGSAGQVPGVTFDVRNP